MAYGDDNIEMLGDEDLFAPEPVLRQRALAQTVRRNPALTTPTSGPPRRPMMPAAVPEATASASGPQPGTYAHTLGLITQNMGQRPDPGQYVEHQRQRQEGSQRKHALGLALGALGGESLSPFGRQFSEQAMKEGGDYEIPGGWGVVGDKGVVWNEEKIREEEQKRLIAMANAQLAAEQRQRASEDANLTKELIAATKGGAKQPNLQRAGTTPSGEVVSYDPSGGGLVVNGKPYSGPMMSQATLDKQATAVQEAMTASGRLRNLDQMVAANPRAFGGVSTISALTPQIIASRWQEKSLTPQEREVRALVMREAAQVINDLYGAAVTAGEMGRAVAFVPTNLDDHATVAVKLKAATEWANSKAATYGRGVRGAAEARMGVESPNAPNAPTAPPPGAVRPRSR